MNTTAQIAKHFREVHFGGNWTASNLKDQLTDINWQQATEQVGSFNTIATLVFHMNYYVSAVTKVLEGGPLIAKDAYSFDHPPITTEADWEALLNKTWNEAETFAQLIEVLPDAILWEDLTHEKYGNYYRNLHGIIEHCHYHLGQIVILKKLLSNRHEN